MEYNINLSNYQLQYSNYPYGNELKNIHNYYQGLFALKNISDPDCIDYISYNDHHTKIQIHYEDGTITYYIIHEHYMPTMEVTTTVYHKLNDEEKYIFYCLGQFRNGQFKNINFQSLPITEQLIINHSEINSYGINFINIILHFKSIYIKTLDELKSIEYQLITDKINNIFKALAKKYNF